jgi:hypothetical protein
MIRPDSGSWLMIRVHLPALARWAASRTDSKWRTLCPRTGDWSGNSHLLNQVYLPKPLSFVSLDSKTHLGIGLYLGGHATRCGSVVLIPRIAERSALILKTNSCSTAPFATCERAGLGNTAFRASCDRQRTGLRSG